MLSQKARYALRALVELARADGAQLTSGELALRADAPRKFLEAILLELSRNQVVTSRRGKFGGYILGRPPDEISFAEVIRGDRRPAGAGALRQPPPRLPQVRRLPGPGHLRPARGAAPRPRRHRRGAGSLQPGRGGGLRRGHRSHLAADRLTRRRAEKCLSARHALPAGSRRPALLIGRALRQLAAI